MIYGYARVSTDAQDLTNQLAQLKAAGCERVFREKISGATVDRPQLRKLMGTVGHGDVLIIPAVDRLSRDTTDLLVIARDLQNAGAGLRSIAEPVVDTTSDFAELVLAMLGVAAKLERRRITERTTRGRADAKAKGVKFGRKPKLTSHQKREAKRCVRSAAVTTSAPRRFRGWHYDNCCDNCCLGSARAARRRSGHFRLGLAYCAMAITHRQREAAARSVRSALRHLHGIPQPARRCRREKGRRS
jgi:DNA invertase Pin-like site-specific DNA recombinase